MMAGAFAFQRAPRVASFHPAPLPVLGKKWSDKVDRPGCNSKHAIRVTATFHHYCHKCIADLGSSSAQSYYMHRRAVGLATAITILLCY